MATGDSDSRSPGGARSFLINPQEVRSAAAHFDDAKRLLQEAGNLLAGLRPTPPASDSVSTTASNHIQVVVTNLQAALNSAERRADDLANGVRLFVASHERNDQDVRHSLNASDE